MSICGVYKIQNSQTGDYYIGSSIDIHKRWIQHRNKLRRNYKDNPILQNAWNKYGEENFVFEILEECDRNEALRLETQLLVELQPYYNVATDSVAPMLGRKHSEETKQKIGRSGIENAFFGRRHSPEVIEKQRLAKLGKKMSEETKRKQSAMRLGVPKPESFKLKMSERMRGNTYGRASKGTKRSLETRQRISRAKMGMQPRLGAVLSEETRQKIRDSLKKYFRENNVPRDEMGRLIKK